MRLAGGAARIPGPVNLVLRTGPVNAFPHMTGPNYIKPPIAGLAAVPISQ